MARPQTTRIGFLSLGLLELVESCILPLAIRIFPIKLERLYLYGTFAVLPI